MHSIYLLMTRSFTFRTARIEVKEGEIRSAAALVQNANAVNKSFAERYYDELVDQRKSLAAQLKTLLDMEAALQAEHMERLNYIGGERILHDVIFKLVIMIYLFTTYCILLVLSLSSRTDWWWR